MHRQHLGSREKTHAHDSEPFATKAVIGQIILERESEEQVLRLAEINLVELQVLASQWPAPLLQRTPFLDNDPNGPFLGVHFKLANLFLTERLSELQDLISKASASTKMDEEVIEMQVPTSPIVTLPQSFPLPRLSLAVECGSAVARLVYDTDQGEKHRAIELRTDGYTLSLNSGYGQPSKAMGRFFPAASSVQPLHWSADISSVLEPVLIRVRSKPDDIEARKAIYFTSDDDFLDDPPLLSLGIFELRSTANAIAQVDGAPGSVAEIDLTSLHVDLPLVFDTLCVELWHPVSVDAALRVLSLLPQRKTRKSSPMPAQSPLARLPSGVSARISVAHFVVFITAPDINPNDGLDLSRGFTVRTTASLEYCCLRPNQDHWFDIPRRSQKRTKLGLPSEPVIDALLAAKTFALPGDKSAFVKLRFTDLTSRAAVATQYEPDEPLIAGRDDIADRSQEFFRSDEVQINLSLSRSVAAQQSPDTCDLSIFIPSIRFDFQLAFVYSILLGFQTIRLITPPGSQVNKPQAEKRAPSISLSVQGNIMTIEGFITLPTQALVFRADGLGGHLRADEAPHIKWTRMAAFVSPSSKVNPWETSTKEQWDEFASLQSWEVIFARVAGSLCISVDGESARIRIPHGFILANLVQDITVSTKAIKHIAHMAGAGCYSSMAFPLPEGPKEVPQLTVRLRCLCLEAQDDPFESRLGLIWRTGAEAVKQRMDREEAFRVKVATVLSTDPGLSASDGQAPKIDPETEYQFDATHTVSIEEARRRLDDVHALDWSLRIDRSWHRRSKEENSVLHKVYGTTTATGPPASLLGSLRKAPPSPPLLRLTLEDLCLTISPPSFGLDQLADVMYDLGNGLPRDTQFSLLVPLHVHFTLSSLLATLRDYPLPLFSISSPPSTSSISLTFETDLIIAEEMGTENSVDWVDCPIIGEQDAYLGEALFSVRVPKTIMPVKTYATPTIKITTPEPTIFSWGVSYGPAIQDVMRVVETLSSAPRDSSPALGFWDKVLSKEMPHISILTCPRCDLSYIGRSESHRKEICVSILKVHPSCNIRVKFTKYVP